MRLFHKICNSDNTRPTPEHHISMSHSRIGTYLVCDGHFFRDVQVYQPPLCVRRHKSGHIGNTNCSKGDMIRASLSKGMAGLGKVSAFLQQDDSGRCLR